MELREFLSELATDPKKLGEFIHDQEAATTAADLSDEDKVALRSGFPAMMYARLAGLPKEKAFDITARAPLPPSAFPPPPLVFPPPPLVWPPPPPQLVFPPPPLVVSPFWRG